MTANAGKTAWLPTLITLAPLCALPAFASTQSQAPPRLWSFDLRAEAEVTYDDNILSLSKNEQNQLKDPVLANTDRFRITSADDVIIAPEVNLQFSRLPRGGAETNILLSLHAYDYTTNSVKNYQQYSLSARQELHRGHVHSTAVTVGTSYIPTYYLRQLVDDDESALAGTTIRNSADYSLTQNFVEVSQEMVNRTLSVGLRYTSEKRDYNDHFNERDSTSGVTSLEFNLYPMQKLGFRVHPYYEREQRNTQGDLGSTGVVDDDAGFDSDHYGLDLRWLWGPNSDHRNIFKSWYEKENRDFNTSNSADTGHFDRSDSITQYGIGYDRELGSEWKIRFGYRYRNNDASTPNGGGGTTTTSFSKNVVSVGVVYRFDPRTRHAKKR